MKRLKMEQQPIQFYFGKEVGKIAETFKTGNDRYIILQNDMLHRKVEKLQEKVNKLQCENEDLNNDNDSLETSKTSLKGYIHNMGAFNQHSRDLVNLYNQKIQNIPKIHNTIVHYCGIYLVFLISYPLMQIYLSSTWISAVKSVVQILILYAPLVYIHIQYMELIEIKDLPKDPQVLKLREELKRAKQGNDYLSDLVDIL